MSAIKLLPCPFCNGVADDKGYGILCCQCGVWLGNNLNSWINETGLSYKERWNMRLYSNEATVPSHNIKPVEDIMKGRKALAKLEARIHAHNIAVANDKQRGGRGLRKPGSMSGRK
jgi:hypothetical protein